MTVSTGSASTNETPTSTVCGSCQSSGMIHARLTAPGGRGARRAGHRPRAATGVRSRSQLRDVMHEQRRPASARRPCARSAARPVLARAASELPTQNTASKRRLGRAGPPTRTRARGPRPRVGASARVRSIIAGLMSVASAVEARAAPARRPAARCRTRSRARARRRQRVDPRRERRDVALGREQRLGRQPLVDGGEVGVRWVSAHAGRVRNGHRCPRGGALCGACPLLFWSRC